jgi:hypothetical protein
VNVLPGLIEGYDVEDIYNAAETDFSLNACRTKHTGLATRKFHSGKKSKDRLTVMVCWNMTGNDKVELLVILVIGKSQKQRCFKNVKSLPLQYFAYKKNLDDLGTA